MHRLFDLHGKRALVTGSGQGIGLALAAALGGAGATVVLNGRDAGKLERAATGLRTAGITVELAPFDVTDAAAVLAGVARIEAEHGAIDILVNNAGIQRRAPLEEFATETWHELMHTNLDSVFYVGQAVARGMIARKQGKIINVCSVQSELGRPSIAPYAASKGAVKMLTKGMCADWAKHGLQINGLARATSPRNSPRPSSTTPSSPTGCASAPRPAAGATSTNSLAPSSSSPPRPPISSTARYSTSTAA